MSIKEPTGRLARWSLCYDSTIVRLVTVVIREFKICYGEALLRRQEVTFISVIFTAHARVWVSGRSRTVCYGNTTKLAYC